MMDGPNVKDLTKPPRWIDSHHHLWRYSEGDYPWMTESMRVIRRDFSIDDLASSAKGWDLLGTVAVQARQTVKETDWLLDIAESSQLIRGVVGWIPLIAPDVEQWLDKWKKRKKLKGIRHVLHDEEDGDYMLRPDFNSGIRLLRKYQLIYDLLIFERHLPQTIEFVDHHPDQMFVLDHIAKPRIRDGAFEPWKSNILRLSKRQNVYCKLSGMVTEAEWSTWSEEQLKPYFEHVLAAFGPSRMMFGSDWPVLTVAASYARWMETVDQWLEKLSDTEASAIRHDNAVRVYQLAS